jgi:nucleoside-diphosphate-sugar epimerase
VTGGVAITGASGFVGRYVLAEFAQRGVEVSALTRRSGADLGPSVHAVQGDISDAGPELYTALGAPSTLVHLAWNGLPNYRAPFHFDEASRQYRFLKAMLDSGVRSLLVTGTCLEYGDASGPLDEMRPTDPRNAYSIAKDGLRRQLEVLRSSTPFHLVWPRLFYMYGEGQAAGSLYPMLAAAAARGDTLFPMSGGEQLRDFLPVTEVARAIVDLVLTAPDAGIVNVCSGRPTSVRALVERWIADNDWQISLDLGRYPYPDYEPLAFWGTTAKLRAALGSVSTR